MPHLRDAAGLGRQRTGTVDADRSGADACGEPNLSGRIPATSRASAHSRGLGAAEAATTNRARRAFTILYP